MMKSFLFLISSLLLSSSLLVIPLLRSCLADDNETLYMASCRQDLGMSSGEIPDSALSSSSSYDVKSVGPTNARIRQEKNGGAWCPKSLVAKDAQEWLQIDLGGLKVVSLVETQGRFGNGQGQEFSPFYHLEYQRENTSRWIRYRDRKGAELITGNINVFIAELRELHPIIIARRIRFFPFSHHLRMVCIRVELYGCPWSDNVISYNMRKGDRRFPDMELNDFSYDGTQIDNNLLGGLGLLTNLEEGISSSRTSLNGFQKSPHEWVGWKNDSQPLEIIFNFEHIRNFSEMSIRANHVPSKEVSIFKKLLIYFSRGGEHYNGNALVYEGFPTSYMSESSFNIIVPLSHNIARSIKLVFIFELKWIMISEVRFTSEMVTVPVSDDIDFITPYSPFMETLETPSLTTYIHFSTPDFGGNAEYFHHETIHHATENILKTEEFDKVTDNTHKGFRDIFVGVIVGSVVSVIVIILVVFLTCAVWRKRKKFNRTVLDSVLFTSEDRSSFKKHSSPGLINGGGKIIKGNVYKSIAMSELIDKDEAAYCMTSAVYDRAEDHQRSTMDGLMSIYDIPSESHREIVTQGISCSLHREVLENAFNKKQAASDFCSTISAQPFFYTDNYNSFAPYNVSKYDPLSQVLSKKKKDEALNIQGVTGTSTFQPPFSQDLWEGLTTTIKFLSNDVTFVEKIGGGQYGDVFLCEASDVDSNANCKTILIMKILKPYSMDRVREDFWKEIRLESSLCDPNIHKLLGTWQREEGSLAAVFENADFGDLYQFMQNKVVDEKYIKNYKKDEYLSYGCLLYIASQISSGMKYLESLGVVHRDLAARNCLLYHHFTIKLSHLAMCRSVYNNDYPIVGTAMLPIPVRWMAWESVALGKFSSKSDVWSFGVTLWELLKGCKETPFNKLTDEQVFIMKSTEPASAQRTQPVLSRPTLCSKETYDLMKTCWNIETTSRPSFQEIHMFLLQKISGFNPDDDWFQLFTK